ncbi:C4-dicarboxylate ABC transporter substrate-binding protein [Marinobacter vinifirmus]|uniref:C4-dicarboxylate ABC transporter substrate-binding protein n=1 Tax=Marinobacter vinifirmus TaxID=355591 RepID=A0A7Z1DSY8_9GAMM|nr:C4-dicarboxylate TRAP transporter substrate-binding protein [Marinobacter vinifirmus]OZC35361.1 C4-dicarboxylate ABC transporter substrate-binding protein [Marinobacter vinifirmus]
MTTKLPYVKKAAKVLFGAALAATLTAGVSAKELRLASGLPPLHPAHDPLYTDFQELLPEYSDGRLSGRLFGTEITTLGNMRASILSGMVEVGLFLPAYFPADLPNFNLVGDLSMLGHQNPQVTAAAMSEYILTCDDCQDEFKKLGVVYTNSHANPYSVLTTKPVTKPEDLDGLRLRTATPQHARWVEAMGGKAVTMATGEAFEALSQRVIDGTVTSISDVISFNLGEVITHITLLDMGTFHSLANHSVRNNVWNGLSLEDREALMKASVVANVRTTARWLEMVAEGKGVAQENGLEILEPEQSLVDATLKFKDDDLVDAAASSEERFGITGAEAKVERFKALVEKWEGLIADTDGSEDAVVALYESEILSKIDLATYGQ